MSVCSFLSQSPSKLPTSSSSSRGRLRSQQPPHSVLLQEEVTIAATDADAGGAGGIVDLISHQRLFCSVVLQSHRFRHRPLYGKRRRLTAPRLFFPPSSSPGPHKVATYKIIEEDEVSTAADRFELESLPFCWLSKQKQRIFVLRPIYSLSSSSKYWDNATSGVRISSVDLFTRPQLCPRQPPEEC